MDLPQTNALKADVHRLGEHDRHLSAHDTYCHETDGEHEQQ